MSKEKNHTALNHCALIMMLACVSSTGCSDQSKSSGSEFKILGRVSDAVVFVNQSTSEIWVEATRGFNAGHCGVLGSGGAKATMQYSSYEITIPDKGWVKWRYYGGTNKPILHTNEVDVSAIPNGRHKADLELTFTTNQTWKATLKSK